MDYKYHIVSKDAVLPTEGLLAVIKYGEAMYAAEIDRMAYGWAMYTRRLAPHEIARAGIVAKPREDG